MELLQGAHNKKELSKIEQKLKLEVVWNSIKIF
jgi:hypothetical protein